MRVDLYADLSGDDLRDKARRLSRRVAKLHGIIYALKKGAELSANDQALVAEVVASFDSMGDQ